MGAIETGTVWLGEEWEPIPGTFLEVRGIGAPRDVEDLDYTVDYGFSPIPAPARTHGLKLSKHGRVILDVVVTPADRNALGVVADVSHLNWGVISVRFGWETPPAPKKGKAQYSSEGLFGDPKTYAATVEQVEDNRIRWDEADEETRAIVRVIGWAAYDRGERPKSNTVMGAAPAESWDTLFEGETDEGWPDWLKALKAEGYDTEDLRAVLDEEDGYTPKSAAQVVDLSDDDWEDEKEMSPEEFQQYMARKAEQGN